jgi:hypothetical protein
VARPSRIVETQRPFPDHPSRAARRSAGALVLILMIALGAAPQDATAQVMGEDGGFLPVQVDAEGNRVLLHIPEGRMGEDFLHTVTLATGLGSPRTLIDRGQTGSRAVVRLERRGNRVHVVQDNWSVRAVGADEAGERAAREGFPTSVVASLPIESEEDGTIVIDASAFFFADAWGVADRLRAGGQGTSRVDRDRSWLVEASSGVFPRNTEVRMALTFVGDQPGVELRRTAPDATAATFEQHHSMLALPDSEGFRPRPFDLRAGLFSTSFWDFAQGFDQNYRGAFANRWRLIPSDTAAYLRGELVEPVEPIVYHVDPGIPSRTGPTSSRAACGGTRSSRRRASGTPSWSVTFRKGPTLSTPGTTCSTGSTVRDRALPWVPRTRTLAPARS